VRERKRHCLRVAGIGDPISSVSGRRFVERPANPNKGL
jgi:hypothetical protein